MKFALFCIVLAVAVFGVYSAPNPQKDDDCPICIATQELSPHCVRVNGKVRTYPNQSTIDCETKCGKTVEHLYHGNCKDEEN